LSIIDRKLRVDIAPVFAPLLQAKRYKGAHGGRGSAKSHFFAEQAISRNYLQRGMRGVCIREVQNSIRDSVRQLLIDKIQKFDLGAYFDVLDNEIRTPGDGLIIFRGMQSYNAETIKSLEGYDWAWVEEGQTLSDHSWSMLRPTLRENNSEIWSSWNPRLRTDAIDKFFRKSPHPDSVCVQANWRDNPWFPDVLMKEMLHDKSVDPELAEHVWEGAYGMDQGAILARWVDRAEKAGRLNTCQYDPRSPPIEITSDIGFRDTASWWVWQRKIGGYSLLHYTGDSGMDAGEWIEFWQRWLKEHALPLGKIWLPHDARAKTFQSKETVIEQFLKAFGAGKCDIVPQSSKNDRINAARTVIQRCEFNAVECEKGLDGLRAWVFEYNPDTLAFSREPLHNWASHPSDAFSYGCQVMQFATVPEVTIKKPKWPEQQTAAEVFDLHATPERREWV
jgi:phage terminase large subunit